MNWQQKHRQNEFKVWLGDLPYVAKLSTDEFQELWNLYDNYRHALEIEQKVFDRVMNSHPKTDYSKDIEDIVQLRMECQNALTAYKDKLRNFYSETCNMNLLQK